MDVSPFLKGRIQNLSLARRLLLGALLWSILLVVGGVFALSAVYRAETLNILDDEHSTTIQTLARAIDLLDDGTGRCAVIEVSLWGSKEEGEEYCRLAVDTGELFQNGRTYH